MCSKERLLEERVEGVEIFVYLIELDVELQRIVSIIDYFIVMFVDYFKYFSLVSVIIDIKRFDYDLKYVYEFCQVVFKFYVFFGVNDEDIWKKIIEIENMMD